jgi:hypothetical protein
MRSALANDTGALIFTGLLSELLERADDLKFGTLFIPGAWSPSPTALP